MTLKGVNERGCIGRVGTEKSDIALGPGQVGALGSCPSCPAPGPGLVATPCACPSRRSEKLF